MITDDDRPRPKPDGLAVGADLYRLSVPELEERIAALEAEIERTRAEIAKKRAQNSAAEALFKSK